jgi:hypothetical protein
MVCASQSKKVSHFQPFAILMVILAIQQGHQDDQNSGGSFPFGGEGQMTSWLQLSPDPTAIGLALLSVDWNGRQIIADQALNNWRNRRNIVKGENMREYCEYREREEERVDYVGRCHFVTPAATVTYPGTEYRSSKRIT